MKVTQEKLNMLPPIIEQYILAMTNTKESVHKRINYRDMLQNVVDVCTAKIAQFEREYKQSNKKQ